MTKKAIPSKPSRKKGGLVTAKSGDRPLTDLKPGESAQVTAMEMAEESLSKMVEMGIGVGRSVALVGKAPMGDPVVIEVIGYRLALRRQEARQIRVAPAGAKAIPPRPLKISKPMQNRKKKK